MPTPTTTQQAEAGCYAPDPRYTFLFSPAKDRLTCTICHDTTLTLSHSCVSCDSCTYHIEDSKPALLPCGHVFGSECLASWLRDHDTCPVCRFSLRYELCGHTISPRELTQGNVLFVPLTVPAGGLVGDQCKQCRRETNENVAAELCLPLAKVYYDLKLLAAVTKEERNERLAQQAKESLDFTMAVAMKENDKQW